MKVNKVEGFTLIELLAVIVILAIIALIATPIVLNIIKETKESAQLRSAEMYLNAVEQSLSLERMNNPNFNPNSCSITSEGNIYCDEKDMVKVEVNGETPINGNITFEQGKITDIRLEYKNKKVIVKDEKGNLVYAEVSDEEDSLAPGLYDENGVMTMSWEELTAKDKNITNGCCVNANAILTVDENGVLTSASIMMCENASFGNFSARYLKGKLVIDNSVKSIGDHTFWECGDLTSVVIPTSVTSLGKDAFHYSALESVIIPDSVTSIGDSAFASTAIASINIPDSVTSIGDSAFASTAIESINIPSSVTSIGDGAFAYSNLTSITIPDSVTSIGKRAFAGCDNLTSIVVDENNKFYDNRENCNAIIETSTNTLIVGYQNTVIPNSVTSIGDSAFEDCENLTSITIPDSVTSIGDSAFEGCENLTSITIPDSVTSIGKRAFEYCYDLKTVEVSNSITSIGDEAFYGCSALTTFTIPDGVTSIGKSAFAYCTSLKTINIPSSVTSIDQWAFSDYSNLTITYTGNTSQWNSINFANDWNWGSAITVCCSNGNITVPAY